MGQTARAEAQATSLVEKSLKARIRPQGIPERIELYYSELSTEYGYQVAVPRPVLFVLAVGHYAADESDDATLLLERLVRLYPSDSFSQFLLGRIAFKKRNFARADRLYEAAVN